MGVYIGYIEKVSNDAGTFYNIKPFAEMQDGQIAELTVADREALLPKSRRQSVMLYYDWNNDSDLCVMEDTFAEEALAIFEFSLNDLDDNINSFSGERNSTGYKIQAIEFINSGKLRKLASESVYYPIYRGKQDFPTEPGVIIDVSEDYKGESVLLEVGNYWAGPYEIAYRSIDSEYVIVPKLKESKYIVSAYKKNDVVIQELTYQEGGWSRTARSWTLIYPKKAVNEEQLDVITDESLLEGFRESLSDNHVSAGIINLEDIPALLKHYDESCFVGADLPENIRKNRLKRLADILISETDLDDSLRTIADSICDLLVRYQKNPSVESWLEALLSEHPELLEKLKGTQAISERIAQTEQELSKLAQQKDKLEAEIQEKKAEADAVNQKAVEEEKEELLRVNEEYKTILAQLDDAKKLHGIVGSIAELQSAQQALKEDVDYLEKHKAHLDRDTEKLELQFQQFISSSHDRMVDIAFDGFMASKMLEAASQWETEKSIQGLEGLIAKVNAIPVRSFTQKELSDYLCQTVQIVRPQYDKNTILNIAICLTQGFLTVFSGEPGCGKTSICNIFADVLGLNKISSLLNIPIEAATDFDRYISVSVERGWTSKRDFVGYYNPLSKTFDKSNRRVYDALCQLNGEKQRGIKNLPYVILLDEANLSPMEYYWSDFMNICDDLGPKSKVNLGEDYVFSIPETLHFLATINNDHTVETLSPRLIDRAWIIQLPQQSNVSSVEMTLQDDQIEVVSWASLYGAFLSDKECEFSTEIRRIYDAILTKLREQRIIVSTRINNAIKRYWVSASSCFENDETGTEPGVIALDYAVVQRILPKLSGHGDSYKQWLEELRSFCSSRGLNRSAEKLKDMLFRGNQQMNYYQFFC